MILNRQRRVRIALPPLKVFLARLRKELRLNGQEVSVALITDRDMARLNQEFRRKRGPTDVLSFPAMGLSRKDILADASLALRAGRKVSRPRRTRQSEPALLGDIAISPQIARCNARRFGRTLPNELRLLILHGVLHLLGYDHESDHGQMARKEQNLRRRLGLD
jgi:probable rRNA maturation factor